MSLTLGLVVGAAGCGKDDTPTGPRSPQATLDAHFEVDNPNGVSFVGITDKAQVFVPGQSGRLQRIEMFIRHSYGTKGLVVDVRNATSSGVPVEDDVNVLAGTTLAADAVPDTGCTWVKVDFSAANVMLASGHFYALVLRVEGNTDAQYDWRGITGNLYPVGGNYFRNPSLSINDWALASSGFDLFFRVHIVPVS